MSYRPPARSTVKNWIKDYPDLEFDGVELRCKICDCYISWNYKTRVVEHIRSQKHKARESNDMTTSERQQVFNGDLLKVMVGCNIPMNKLNNAVFRQFLQNCVNGKYNNVTVPAESTLRTNYLPTVYDEVKTKIISELEDKYVWIGVDETTDPCDRNIANVLVGGMDETTAMPARLLSSNIMERVNEGTICQVIDDSFKTLWDENYEANKGRVLLFVTGAAAYMKAAGKRVCETYCNALHVTCLADGLHRVAETIRECYSNVDKLIANVAKIFLKAPARIDLFQETLPGVPLPPEPILTRWGTWLEASSYYYVHFDGIKSFVRQLNSSDATSILYAKKIFNDPRLREDLTYIHFNYSRIPSVIRRLETTATGYSITNAVNNVYDLRHFISQLSGPSAERVKKKIDTVLQTNPGFLTLCSIVDLFEGKEVDFSEPSLNVPSVKNYTYFKYAPVTSVDVERTFSKLKWIFKDKRRSLLTPEHLQQLLVIQFYSYTTSE